MSDLEEHLLTGDYNENPIPSSQLLSPETSQMTAAGVMTCLKFVEKSDIEKYYLGEIYKKQTFNPITGVFSVARKLAGFHEFISYKFRYDVGGKQYTFVITFREKNFKMVRNFFKKEYQKYHIRLSILPENGLRCERKHVSIMLTSDGNLEFPANIEANFTSIYKGQWTDDAIVKNMREKNIDEISQEIKAVVENIKKEMGSLGQILVDKCTEYTAYITPRQNPVGGGYSRKPKRLTHNRKSALKRKNKKSYKKKNYGKSNKSRRFRRSVRSRR
jgi:hypothetical protein